MMIRGYEEIDENSWLRCRVLSFLDTSYYDKVLKQKPRYEKGSIELVAANGEEIVGLIDIELDALPGDICSDPERRGGLIRHLAVHPDHRRQGIGSLLLIEALGRARTAGMQYLEAWIRDDQWVRDWCAGSGFRLVDSYLQVYVDGEEDLKGLVESKIPQLHPVSVFAHYTGSDKAYILSKFTRVHEMSRFDLDLTDWDDN
ncbi:GNAT family N-acetyltransferase [Saccharibacillus qingshengii]|uniref:GNAT family N-acetyltransferase n=1 Tax=Saccharibacillus qingshengii TaxID=1763540 RepID=UPI001557D1A9|nr:GNAT family N-acetyltransferase [Saccharibacillus qingshengii]